MEFLILGPIEVRSPAGAIALGGIKPRAVLAVLLLHPNEPVSAERLALALWGEDAPGGAVKTVQVHVSRLRKALGDADAVTTTPAGYRLRVRRGELDSERFEGLVEDAREVLDGQPEEAAALLREALALWRGPALAELALEPFAGTEIARLEEQRLTALELRIEADLAAGRHAEVVGELRQLVVDHPLRERLAGQLMLGLYRCGRQTEALEAYAAARKLLVDEAGIEPGPQLRDLHQQILRQDAGLEAQTAGGELPAALDTTAAKPLAGRERELEWLQSRWERARSGAGGVVAVTGVEGAGKTRLAGELARAAHRPGVSILHATGKGPADSILVALRRVRDATRPTLLVIDDADSAGAGVQSELERLAPALAEAPVLIVACARDVRAVAGAGDALELAALDAEAVRAIAAPYAPARPAADVPAEWLRDASDGIPRRVHDVASQWARREAARHVGAVAGRAETGRAELRAIEEELAGGIAELQESHERGGGGSDDDDDPPVVCPYKGLAAYDVGDAPYFFGREQLVAELVARLVGAQLLGIVGPSGSGKSSVLRAGLLPALASGVLPDSERWARVLLRPGEHPLRELHAALEGTPATVRLLVAVDQFEELFTACEDETERVAFVDELVELALHPARHYVVVLALRADSYGRCAAYPQLAALLAASNVLVGAMQPDELRRVVELPAQRAGLRIEQELVDALVADVEREPGGLPLLSTALLELWRHRDGRRLRHAAYERMGGVRGAVARLAEEAFAQLDAGRQQIARDVLMRLVGTDEDGTVERRRIGIEELEIERDEDVSRVVALLTDSRLLTVSAGTVELAHEALLREWPRLGRWIDEDREGLRVRRGLSAAAREWDELHRDDGALYRGTRLAEALEWRDARGLALNELEREFLAASEAALQRDRVTRRRRMTLAFGAIGVALVALAVVAVVANRSSVQGKARESSELATRSADLVDSDPGRALVVARAALDRFDTPEAQNAVRQATLLDRGDRIVRMGAPHYRAVLGPDGKTVAAAGDDGSVRIVSLASGKVVTTVKAHAKLATDVSFSPDGKQVASVGNDGAVVITDLATRKPRVVRRFTDEKTYADRVEYDRAGAQLLIGVADDTARLVNVSDGRDRVTIKHTDLAAAHFDRDARHIVTVGEDGARVWGLAGNELATYGDGDATFYDAGFSPDGRSIATAGPDGTVRIFSRATGAVTQRLELDAQTLYTVLYSPDGRRLVTAGADGVVRVSDARGGEPIAELKGHRDIAWDAGFEPDSKRVFSVGIDGTLRTWTPLDTTTDPAGDAGGAYAPSFSPDGKYVVNGYDSGLVSLWDPQTGDHQQIAQLNESGAAVYSANGAFILSSSSPSEDPGEVELYNVAKHTSSPVPVKSDKAKFAAAIDPAGRRIAVAGQEERVVVLAPDGSRRVTLEDHGQAYALAFSPDGKHLAVAWEDGMLRTFNATTGANERTFKVSEGGAQDAAYSPDRKRIAAAGADGTVRTWRLDGSDERVYYGHDGTVNAVSFNGRGDRIVSGGKDGTVRIWDAAGGDVRVLLSRHVGEVYGVDVSPVGEKVVSASDAGIQITACEVCGALSDVLSLAAKRPPVQLSAAERERLVAAEG